MDLLPYVVGWLLAGTLLLSGAVKAADPVGTARSLRDYGLLPTAPKTAGAVTAAVEMAAAVILVGTLLSGRGRPAGLAMALVLFLIFAGLQARSLIAGRRHPCGCFGRDEPVSGRTLLRSAALAAAAAAALALTLAGAADLSGGRLLLSFVVAAAAVAAGGAGWVVRSSRDPVPVPSLSSSAGIFGTNPSTSRR